MEADGHSVFAGFDRLDVRLSAASLLHRAPVVREVHLSKPYVHLARMAPHQYSTDDIVAALSAGPPKPPPPPDAPPAQFSANNIEIDGGRFVFDDVPNGTHHEIADFSLGVPFISSFPAEEAVFVEPRLSAVVDGAPLHLTGEAQPFATTRAFALALDFDKVDLTRYLDYLPAPPPVHLPTGTLDLHLKLKIEVPKDQPLRLGVAGKAVLRSLDIRTTVGKPLVKLAEVELAVDEAHVPAGPLAATVTVNRTGRIVLTGDTAMAPLHANLALKIEKFDLLPLQPLFGDRVNLRVTHADLAASGKLLVDQAPGGPLKAGYTGDASLDRFATVDSLNGNDFLNCDSLALRGIRFDLAPLVVHVDQVALDKLYARVIISPDGHINLQDIVKQQRAAKISLTDNSPTGTAALDKSAPAAPPSAAPAAPAAAQTPVVPIAIGKVLVTGGHVRFSDNFIKPRYSADLLDLNGSVAGLSADPASQADIDVRGKVNDAPLLIGGHVNPLARNLALDIKASVHDMELAPLSPYSAKYVGYRIERGKLSFDVAYQLADRQLHAQNRLVLDQLTFGEKVDSPTATSLPVQLAVALLKDRNGVIDINLPIGGSLDDPDFSVGRIIVNVLINLITKAVTAPFALIGNLFGGSSEELSSLEFDPGRHDVSAAREASLKSLAKALAERPGLKLDITGWADPVADREALGHLRVEGRLRAIKRKDLLARGTSATAAELVVLPTEHPALLARAYQAEILDKQPPPAGVAASRGRSPAATAAPPPTPQQMEQALFAQQQISDDDLRTLGNRRAQAAKDWLRTIGLVPEERMALVDSRVGPAPDASADGASRTAGAKSNRVEFGLR
jgi:outer membrane protein OmpA-like peptidoglycan-associated protein